jgi:predicted small secreted protein
MKKTILYIFGILLVSAALTNCGSSKKGCGLSSDAVKIEQTTQSNTPLVAQR